MVEHNKATVKTETERQINALIDLIANLRFR